MTRNHIVQYIVVREDLISKMSWPFGAVLAQACHASVAIIFNHHEDSETSKYLSDIDNMRKVVLKVKDGDELSQLSEKLKENNVLHKLWMEQPENIATCIALKPYKKDAVKNFLKHLDLYN